MCVRVLMMVGDLNRLMIWVINVMVLGSPCGYVLLV